MPLRDLLESVPRNPCRWPEVFGGRGSFFKTLVACSGDGRRQALAAWERLENGGDWIQDCSQALDRLPSSQNHYNRRMLRAIRGAVATAAVRQEIDASRVPLRLLAAGLAWSSELSDAALKFGADLLAPILCTTLRPDAFWRWLGMVEWAIRQSPANADAETICRQHPTIQEEFREQNAIDAHVVPARQFVADTLREFVAWRLEELKTSFVVGPARTLWETLSGESPLRFVRKTAKQFVLAKAHRVSSAGGDLLVLHVELLSDGNGEIFPDPRCMDAHVMHDEFLAAPERAWRYACRRVIVDKLPFNPRLHDLRWHLAGFPEGAGAPLTGGSLGGAFGIAALRFVRGEHVDSRCAVTGALDPTWQPNSDAPMRLLPIIGEAEKLNAAFPPAEGVEPEFAVAETAADGVRLFDGSHRGRDVGVRRVVFPEACRTIARDLAGQAGLDVDLAVAFAGTLDDVLSRTDAYDDDRRFRGDAFDVLRRARQQPFLHRYLGPTTAFGGRDAEFALLDEFLRSGGSPGRSRAPRRLLLTGQGGAGKSALLCRWQARVRDGFVSVADADQREWAVIHVPISRRDDTNRADQVHRTLALELSLLYGERIAQPDQVPSHAWRDFVTTWLTNPPPCGRRVLVILDGLDELVGRESLPNCLQFGFPPQPPEWLRIVAAARCAEHDDQWAKALRWFAAPQAIRRHLEYLTRDQIRALLLAEEIPYANSPDELTDRLFTLTRGRPLVLQRYLSLLRSEQHSLFHLTPADLATLTPARMHEYDAASTDHDSLATLFTFWSERLEDSFGARARDLTTAARNLLGVLAMGLGPLNETDWRRLAGVETAPTSYAFNDALTAVKFFVEEVPSLDLGGLTRAAPAESAWTYQHPEFAVHLLLHSGWYRPADVAAFEQLYLMWGEACLRGLDSNSPSVPGYVQSYYSLHIEQANQLTDAERLSRLTRLLDADWCEAWQRYTSRDDYSGYLADVARAAAVARQLNEAHKTLAKGEAPFFPHFSIECRIELIRASIRTLQAKIPPELVAALFRAGDWTAAQTFQVLDAAMATKDFSRAAKLVHLLTSALDASRIDGHCFLNRLVNVARSIDYPQLRARVLAAIVRQLPTHEALDVGRSIDRPYWRARALASVGKRLPLRGAVEIRREAVNLARSIHSPYSRGRALAEIVEQLPFDEVVEIRREALDAARSIDAPDRQACALAAIAEHLPYQEALVVRREALNAARSSDDPDKHALALLAIVKRLPLGQAVKIRSEILSVVRNLGRPFVKDHVLAAIASRLPPHHALKVARSIHYPDLKGRALAAISERLPLDKAVEIRRKALNAARSSDDPDKQARALAAIAERLPPHEGLEVARSIDHDSDLQAETLTTIAERLPAHEAIALRREVLEIVWSMNDSDRQAATLMAIAGRLPRHAAVEVARSIDDVDLRAVALAKIAEWPSQDGRGGRRIDDLNYELDLNHRLDLDDQLELDDQTSTFMATAERLPPHDALAAARSILSPYWQARALAMTAKRLPSDEALEVRRELLGVVRYISPPHKQASILAATANESERNAPCTAMVVWEWWTRLSAFRRYELFAQLRDFAKALAATLDETQLKQIADAVVEVGRRWR